MNSNNSDIYEVIERYFSGTLPEEEKELFEEKLQSDEVLKQKVNVFKASRNAILQNKLNSLKGLMDAESGKVNKPGSFNKLWSAIIIVSLIGGGFLLWYTNKQRNHDSSQEKTVAEKSGKSSVTQDNNSEESETKEYVGSKEREKISGQPQIQITESEKNTVEETNEKTTLVPPSLLSDNVSDPSPVRDKDSTKSSSGIPFDPCKGVKISAQPVLHEPCAGSSDGFIELKDLHGGKSPYIITLNGAEHGSSTLLKELPTGKYEIKVSDLNGCIHQFNPLILKEKDCVLRYDFNPGRGEEWQGPVVEASRLTIMDKSGKVVYTKQMNDGEQCTWNGYNQSGTLLLGYFVFMIEHKGGKVIKGSITVTE